MNLYYLDKLRQRYGGHGVANTVDPLAVLLSKYREYRATTLLDCAAVSSQLAVEDLLGPDVDPLALRALHDTNPYFDPSTYHSADEWSGIINAAKGKYFEYLVADRLNDGQAVGDVVLPEGYRAVVADSMDQPGWDLRILDANGQVDQYLQLKATDSTSYIHHALERYPEIKILASSEVATSLDGNHMILDSGISEDQLHAAVETAAEGKSGFIDGFWEHFHPILPLLLIAGMQGYQVAVGKRSVQDAMEIGMARTQRALAMAGTGALVKAIGGGLLAIPAVCLVGIWVTESQTIDELIGRLKKQNRKLFLQSRRYKDWRHNYGVL
ncbi:hypothetical protein [Vogesella indigofera]|uniref:hypothetical protein n=1 Tax=Vogesella indigofera TaxID=45465 RepID=UPI00234F50DC|nr:hypothetical protein [Vogesella indigofera]MDC7706558.1 hypothetical protein [Vogesella indigofera]